MSKASKRCEERLTKKGCANATINNNSEDNSAFFLEGLDEDNTVDWFTKDDEDNFVSIQVSEELSEAEMNEHDLLFSVDLDLEWLDLGENAANVDSNIMINHVPCVEVYNSGCMKHITPYKSAVTNFIKIPPKSFRAANKQSFKAIETGKMIIDVPNSANISQLKLKDVLYSLKIGYILVSIGCLDDTATPHLFLVENASSAIQTVKL